MARIKEATGTLTASGPGRIVLQIITPGRGSSGTYTPELLEQAAKDNVFPKNTQNHIDHSTATEDMERPERTLKTLAGITLEDARWDPQWVDAKTGEKGALVAEAMVGSAWRDFVSEYKDAIGVSINAAAEINESGEITRLIPDPFNTVDYVTIAGRGGRVAEVREAARAIESRVLVKEVTADDVRMFLHAAVRDTHATNGEWAYLTDHDDTYAYFELGANTYRQKYTVTGMQATFTGEPERVQRHTEYDPITESPSDPAGATEKKEGATMATIDDKELADLREAAGRVTALEKELKDERDAREADARKAAEAAVESRRDLAMAAVQEAFGKDAPAFHLNAARLAATDEGYNHDEFVASLTEAAAASESANGAGTPSGVGETAATGNTEYTTESADAAIAKAFGRTVKEA